MADIHAAVSVEVANFFWHGSELSRYERACIASFVHRGFAVKLWSFHDIDVPVGVERCDAALIYPESRITQYTQAGVKGSLPSFANFFRYKLLSEHEGWWFDSDVLLFEDC